MVASAIDDDENEIDLDDDPGSNEVDALDEDEIAIDDDAYDEDVVSPQDCVLPQGVKKQRLEDDA